MRKPKEIEELIKRAIRDELALFPLKSVAQVRNALYLQGYQSVHGELDWHYISKLMKRVRKENLSELTSQSRAERLANLKERHRLVTQKLASILNDEPRSIIDKSSYPTHTERIAAANTILKWDMALFFAEEQIEMTDSGKETSIMPIVSIRPILLTQSRPKARTVEVSTHPSSLRASNISPYRENVLGES